ncbi:sodium:proton exchanger, partial [Candidatus Woesearchaeota archaeon]|nr:sodium:proton exchanger [Candidatus Woesearchaeota archaeon]
MDIFTEIGLIIILASLVAYIFKLLKQPLIPAYVVAGLLVTPLAGLFGLSFSKGTIWTLSEIGIAFLLFT